MTQPTEPGQVPPMHPGPDFGSPPAPDSPAPTDPPPAASAATPAKLVERPHPLTPLARGWVALVAIGWIVLQEFIRTAADGTGVGEPPIPTFGIIGIIAAVAVLIGVSAVVTWFTTKFIADTDELRVETGWLFKQSRRIAYTRIQSVDVVQRFATRLLGLAEVRIDAGAGDSTKLVYLSRKRAYELRDYLMRRAHGEHEAAPSQSTPSVSLVTDLSANDRVLVTIQPPAILLGALMSVEFMFLIVGLAVPLIVAFVLSRYLPEDVIAEVGGVIAVGTLFPLIIGIFGFFSRRVLAEFNYTLAQTSAGLRITRGLTNLTSQTVPVRRIQSIRVSQPLLWRLLNRYRVDIEVLGYGELTTNETSSNTSTVLMPIGSVAQVDTALHAVWPGLRLDAITFHKSPSRARWLDPLSYSWNGYGADSQVVVARRGWLTRVQSIIPHARLQSTFASQGPLERMMGLADVSFHTTGLLRQHAVVHLDAQAAHRLVYEEADLALKSRTQELTGASGSAPDLDMAAPPVQQELPVFEQQPPTH